MDALLDLFSDVCSSSNTKLLESPSPCGCSTEMLLLQVCGIQTASPLKRLTVYGPVLVRRFQHLFKLLVLQLNLLI